MTNSIFFALPTFDVGLEKTVTLTEESVGLLERHWGELCGEAYSIAVEGGWKVRRLRSDGLFSRAGIRDHAHYTPAVLLAQAKTFEQRALVERMLAILEHIDATRSLAATA